MLSGNDVLCGADLACAPSLAKQSSHSPLNTDILTPKPLTSKPYNLTSFPGQYLSPNVEVCPLHLWQWCGLPDIDTVLSRCPICTSHCGQPSRTMIISLLIQKLEQPWPRKTSTLLCHSVDCIHTFFNKI